MPVIISLSTIPSRFDKIGPTLESLLAQSAKIDEIRIYIPKSYLRFPEYDGVFWEFWKEFTEDYNQTYQQIYSDIQHRQHGQGGQLIICMNEHAPSERALPILERIVVELEIPRLNSEKDMKANKRYKQSIEKWYATNLPKYESKQLKYE